MAPLDVKKEEGQSEKPVSGSIIEDPSASVSSQEDVEAEAEAEVEAAEQHDVLHPYDSKANNTLAKVARVLNWMPQRCRYDPENPPTFTLSMNIMLALVCMSLDNPRAYEHRKG